jgi:hypothetical protein
MKVFKINDIVKIKNNLNNDLDLELDYDLEYIIDNIKQYGNEKVYLLMPIGRHSHFYEERCIEAQLEHVSYLSNKIRKLKRLLNV